MQQVRFRRIRDGFLIGLAALFATTAAGCFGRFRAMNAVYDFNKEASNNPVVRSLVLFAMLVIPVYFVAFLVDWIVLNTMDFFNGGAQLASKTFPDGTKVEMAKLDADTVRVRQVDPAGRENAFDIVRVGPNAGYVRARRAHRRLGRAAVGRAAPPAGPLSDDRHRLVRGVRAAAPASTATLLVSCRDRTGLVAALSDFVFDNDGNILDADQHAELETGLFFMRLAGSSRPSSCARRDPRRRSRCSRSASTSRGS